MISQKTIDNNVEQGIAAYVDYLNNLRLSDLLKNLDLILTNETDKLADLAARQAKALSNLDWAKSEIDNLINTNRGGDTGVHGFIAEFAETGIRNAKDAFDGLRKSVVILNDNGPADILLNGKEAQMKFYANLADEIKQASNYQGMKMMYPKDHIEIFEKIMNGEKTIEFHGGRLSNAQINHIKQLIEDERKLRGEPFDKWIKSSVLNYKDVQKGTIDQTISNEVDDINKKAANQKADIKSDADKDRIAAHQKSQASFGEATKAAGIGAAVQGGLNLGIFVYKKHKDGKEIWEFTAEDWKESGIETAKGAIKGGISGYAIYGLTNVCHLAAPSAGAITSGTFGLANAVIKFRTGEVDDDGFIDLVTMNAIDATGAAVGAAIGQAVIPVPVVGALVGSIVATTALSLCKGMLSKHELEILNQYQAKVSNYINALDAEYKTKLDELMDKYHKLGQLQDYSFNFDINVELQFVASIDLARFAGVSEKEILHNESEIDNYFLA